MRSALGRSCRLGGSLVGRAEGGAAAPARSHSPRPVPAHCDSINLLPQSGIRLIGQQALSCPVPGAAAGQGGLRLYPIGGQRRSTPALAARLAGREFAAHCELRGEFILPPRFPWWSAEHDPVSHPPGLPVNMLLGSPTTAAVGSLWLWQPNPDHPGLAAAGARNSAPASLECIQHARGHQCAAPAVYGADYFESPLWGTSICGRLLAPKLSHLHQPQQPGRLAEPGEHA